MTRGKAVLGEDAMRDTDLFRMALGIDAHSGDCDRPFQPKVITDSGDRDHVLTRPTEAA
jgi:hypothetical protein